MDDLDPYDELAAIIMIVVLIFAIVFTCVYSHHSGRMRGLREAEAEYQQQAIDCGYAEYHSTTGAWKWLSKEEEEE